MAENTSKKSKDEEVSEAKKQDNPESNLNKEVAAEPGTPEAQASAAPGKKGFTAKATASVKPAECAACGKAFPKKMSYYKNGGYYCNKQCFRKKNEEGKAKAEEAKKK